jgi:DNA-nicking Smr family endonuclease
MAKRSLTDDEKNLWKNITDEVKPLSSNKMAPTLKPFPKQKDSPPPVTLDNLDIGRKTSSMTVISLSTRDIKDVVLEGTLDLHGYTTERAARALEQFLISRQQRSCRWVLVITGKGEEGVLKEFVLTWLKQHPQLVIGYTYATPKHGGEGALYVNIRKIKWT